MKFSDVMAFYDYNMTNIVRDIHAARETVNSWKKNDLIPFNWQCVLEVKSGGKLKANEV